MSIRIRRRSLLVTPETQKIQGGLRKLEETINLDDCPSCSDYCRCNLCRSHEVKI